LDEADLRDLVAVFLLDAPGRLTRIGRHLDAFERARLPAEGADALAAAAHEAHSLRGAAASVLLDELAAHAERLELALRDDDARRNGQATVQMSRGLLRVMASIVAEVEAPEEALAPPPTRCATRLTVLSVEDNLVNATLVERALARRPWVRLLAADRAECALRLANRERPDLILLDLHLPDASGHEFLRRLRTAPALRDVAVVIVSADDPPRGVDSQRPLEVREYLTKPIDVGRLLELVDELAQFVAAPTNGGRP
jgi:CheY-like chemotaxis protein